MARQTSKAINRSLSWSTRMPGELRDRLRSFPKAENTWSDITPLARRDWIVWINSAKKPETRLRRIAKACSMLSSGKRRVCCFGGINWLIKTYNGSDGKKNKR